MKQCRVWSGVLAAWLVGCAATPNEGSCKVGMWVEVDGTITDPAIVESSGFAKLDAACLDAVRGRKLNPGTENGVPVRMHTILPITGRLTNGRESPGVFMNGPMVPAKAP
jgi:TonB family protein